MREVQLERPCGSAWAVDEESLVSLSGTTVTAKQRRGKGGIGRRKDGGVVQKLAN